MKKFLCIMALAPWVTFAGTFTVTNLNTTLVVPHSVADQSLSRIIPWKTNTVYPAGALVSINRTPYVSQYSGTSGFGDYGGPVTNITWVTTGANGIAVAITNVVASPNVSASGSLIHEGTMTWLQARVAPRAGATVQWVSGGTATVVVNGGALALSSTGIQAFSIGPDYQGAIYITASGGNVVVNTTDW